MEKATEAFLTHQEETEDRFRKQEEERWKKETEIEDKRRSEDRAHEIRMLEMMAQAFQGRPSDDYLSNEYSDWQEY